MKKSYIGKSISYIFLSVLSVVVLFPLLWLVLSSLKSKGEMLGDALKILPEKWTLSNFSFVLNTLKFSNNIVNSFVVAGGATLISIILSCMAAYGIVKFFPVAGKYMTRFLITTYMFPAILLAIPYSLVISKIGLGNSRTGLIITYLSFSIPYAVWLLVGFFRTVPQEVEEAARIDGAGYLGTFARIAVPIVAPGIVATAIYTFINAWNEFLLSMILINSSRKMTVSVALYSLTGAELYDWSAMVTAAVLVILPSILFFLSIQNKMAGGLAEGSIK